MDIKILKNKNFQIIISNLILGILSILVIAFLLYFIPRYIGYCKYYNAKIDSKINNILNLNNKNLILRAGE